MVIQNQMMFRCNISQIIHDFHCELTVTVEIINLNSFDTHFFTPYKCFFYLISTVKIENMDIIKFIYTIPQQETNISFISITYQLFNLCFIIIPEFPAIIDQTVWNSTVGSKINIIFHCLQINGIRRRRPP